MLKRTCDCCDVMLDTSAPKIAVDAEGNPKMTNTKKYDPILNKMIEFETYEFETTSTSPVIIQLNLNNHDMIYREYCKECYKKIHTEVEKFWNILYATYGI